MTLRLRNTLGRAVEPVIASDGARIRMYTCGPTVYRWAHVGNLRTYLLADFIRRAFLYHGVDVLHVKNITDVGHLRDERFDRGEDRMLVAAGLEDRSPREIADAYEAGFHADEARVNILPAHVFPRATEHVAEMLDLAAALVSSGHAYVSADRNVYYDVASYPAYGELSGNTLDHLRAGHRGDVEADKRDPADFALWKAAGEGRLLKWPSPWGEGYPGWHLECSAMARRYLGDRFDLHTGGVDNMFPHHEDELAQSAPVVGGPLARHWVHGEHLLASGQKMAKSAGNFERVTELPNGVEPLALRYLAMTVRYRKKLDYSPGSITAAAAALRSLRSRLASLAPPPADGPWSAPVPLVAGAAVARPDGVATGITGHGAPLADDWLRDRAHDPTAPLSDAGRDLHRRFVDALDDDLDLPAALSVVREILRSDLAPDERRWLVLDADIVLGLDLDRVWDAAAAEHTDPAELDQEAARLVEERSRARASHDWATADALRERLAELGVEVEDRPDGTTAWRVTSRA